MSGCGQEARDAMVQQKLLFEEDGGHDPEREQNSCRGTGALQVHPASTESKATNVSLIRQIVQEETSWCEHGEPCTRAGVDPVSTG